MMAVSIISKSLDRRYEALSRNINIVVEQATSTLEEGLGVINERTQSSLIPKIALCINNIFSAQQDVCELMSSFDTLPADSTLKDLDLKQLSCYKETLCSQVQAMKHLIVSLQMVCDAHRTMEVSRRLGHLDGDYQLPEACRTFIYHLLDGHELTRKEELGKGAFGYVKKIALSHAEYAEKRILPDKFSEYSKEKLTKEAALLLQIVHPNVIQLAAINLNAYMIYMNVASRNSFFSNIYIKDIYEPPTFLNLFIDIAKGLEYLEKLGIVHSDLHLGNLLIDEDKGTLKGLITDFDLSSQHGVSDSMNGNQDVIAPEKLYLDENLRKRFLGVFCKKKSFLAFKEAQEHEELRVEHPILRGLKKPLSSKLDAWSFGMDLFAMMCGGNSIYKALKTRQENYLKSSVKFSSAKLLELAQRKFKHQQQHFKVGFPFQDPLAIKIREAVLAPCFKTDPEERASITYLREALEDLHEEQMSKALSSLAL